MEEIDVISDPLADLYAQRMLEDLQEVMRFVVTKANAVSGTAGSVRAGGNVKRCDTNLVREAVVHFQQMEPRMTRLRADAAVSFAKKQQEQLANAETVRGILDLRRRQLNQSVTTDR